MYSSEMAFSVLSEEEYEGVLVGICQASVEESGNRYPDGFAPAPFRGNGGLIGALLLGYFTGGIFVGTMVYRIWRSAGLSADGAKKQMLWGLVLRLGMLFIVLFTAVHISVQVFGVTVLGFLLFYGLSLVHLVQGNIDIKNF